MEIAEKYISQYANMKQFFETVINGNKRVRCGRVAVRSKNQ